MQKKAAFPSKGDSPLRTTSVAGDIVGTRNGYWGMVPKLLTDARETSYWI